MKRLALLIPLLLACGPFFYQAPPTLAHYPERIPTKNWQEILSDQQAPNGITRAALISDIQEFTREITTLEKEIRLKKTEAFITKNRQGHFAVSVANFLLELRELIELDVPDPELQSYLEWRSTRLPSPSPPKAPARDWRLTKAEHQEKLKAHNRALLAFLDSHNERIASASPNLKPFEIIQRGGMFFRMNLLDLAELDFLTVQKSFPDHPRAEIATFMLGRTAFQKIAKLKQRDFKNRKEYLSQRAEQISKTNEAFHKYLNTYPEGRFVNDAFGWLGGIARENDNIRLALNLQLRRLEIQPTREVTAAVLRECNQIFADYFLKISATPHQSLFSDSYIRLPFDFDKLAGHPAIVSLLISHTLDPSSRSLFRSTSENFSGDRRALNFLHRRIIIPGPYATAALSQLGQAIVKRNLPHDATSFLVVGWASARSGDHHQALQLFELGLQKEITDELLHGKAIALARLDRAREAAAIFGNLITKFPESPLSEPSRFDLAQSLLHSGEAGQSLLIFHELARKWEQATYESPHTALHPANEVKQWIDMIVHFSPLPELQKTFSTLPPEHPAKALLRRTISMRAICAGDFESVIPLVIPGKIPDSSKRWRIEDYFDLTRERLDRDITPLIDAHQKLVDPDLSSRAKALLHLEIGLHWKAKRGLLTLPLLNLTGPFHSQPDLRDQLLHDNARHLGLEDAEIESILLSRDELFQAFHHFRQAARLSYDPEIAAPALEEANEALFRMAELSPYRAAYAASHKHTELSLELVTRLQTDFPDRPEAARAHPFTFLPPILLGDWMPGDRISWIADQQIAEVFYSQDQDTEKEVTKLINSLSQLSKKNLMLPEIRTRLAELSKEFASLRPGLSPATLIRLSGHLDDLQIVANHPGVTSELFREYLPLRLSDEHPPLDQESPLAPFLDFLQRARDPQKGADWAGYLATYPNGPKNEAASLRLVRREFRKSFPIPHVRPVFFPGAPRTTGYKILNFPLAAGNTLQARDLLRKHRQTYQNRKYQADLDLLEAAALASEKDYSTALKILAGIITDPAHPELYQDASLQFAELSLRLLDIKERAALAPAFKNNPAALTTLKKLAQGGTCVSRVRPLIPALQKD